MVGRKPNGLTCLFRITIGLYLHNLPILNRMDIGNPAFYRLTPTPRPGLVMHKNDDLVPDFEDLFGQALGFPVSSWAPCLTLQKYRTESVDALT